MLTLSRRNFLAGLAAALALPKPSRPNLSGDPLRPQFHLLPAANWMNDPNGPIFYNRRYHMFYQYNPNGAFWGDMHWGHASSPDMVHWRHEPVALAPTPGGYDRDGVFSGPAVLDRGTPALIYTGVLPPATPSEATLKDGVHSWREVQCLAVSHDGLRTWQKIPEPILASPPAGLAVTGFRDPCLWREGDHWRMILGSGFPGKGGAILLYSSGDLRHWTYLHPLLEGPPSGKTSTNPVDSGEMWECPDFFPLGDRHVLLISTMGKVFWKVGTYRDQRFHPETEGTLDFGSYYAARSMLDRNGNRILWGWIPETRPESQYRAAGWAGVMSLPRVLSLGNDGTLRMKLAPEVEALRGPEAQLADLRADSAAIPIRDLSAELLLTLMPDRARPFRFELRSEQNELFATIAYEPQQRGRELTLNQIQAPLPSPAGQPVSLRLLLDGSVLELFANDSVAITDRVYLSPKTPLKIVLQRQSPPSSLHLWPINPISRDRLTT